MSLAIYVKSCISLLFKGTFEFSVLAVKSTLKHNLRIKAKQEPMQRTQLLYLFPPDNANDVETLLLSLL